MRPAEVLPADGRPGFPADGVAEVAETTAEFVIMAVGVGEQPRLFELHPAGAVEQLLRNLHREDFGEKQGVAAEVDGLGYAAFEAERTLRDQRVRRPASRAGESGCAL